MPEGYRFDQAIHLHEVTCWNMAVHAYDVIGKTDVRDALSNLEDA